MARILVVDDDPDVVEACKHFLEKAHHQVMAASSRRDGTEAVATFKPELLILDIIMEQSDDGIAMARELRRAGFEAPIMMLTSLRRATGTDMAAENLPVDDFLEKPIDPDTLLEKAEALLKSR